MLSRNLIVELIALAVLLVMLATIVIFPPFN